MLIIDPHINKYIFEYFRPNIHQNSPEILEINRKNNVG
jgi:hypothetical protein